MRTQIGQKTPVGLQIGENPGTIDASAYLIVLEGDHTVPKRKRVQREHTEDWQTIQQYTLWPEQTAYELLRPVVLFGDPAIQRAQETGEPRTSW